MRAAKRGSYRDAYRKLPEYQKVTIFFLGVALIGGNVAVQIAGAIVGGADYTIGHAGTRLVTLMLGALCVIPERLFALLEKIPLPDKWHRDG